MALPNDCQEAALRAKRSAARLRLAAALLLAVLLLAVAAAIANGWHRELSLEALVHHRATLEAVVADHLILALTAYIALYTVAASCSLPGVVFLTIGGGAVFGWTLGSLAAVAGATTGATVVFLIAKSLVAAGAPGGWLARRAGPLAARFAAGFREDAFNYLLFMRLVPVFPFFLVNLVPALCGVGLKTFVTATAIGVVPGTLAFALFGAGLDSAFAAQTARYRDCLSAGGADCRLDFSMGVVLTPQLIAGLVALGAAALVPVAVRRWRTARAPSSDQPTGPSRPPS